MGDFSKYAEDKRLHIAVSYKIYFNGDDGNNRWW